MHISDPGFRSLEPIALLETEVQLWRVDLDFQASKEEEWRELLSADERGRAARFVPARARRQFVITRGVLRVLLARYLNASSQDISFVRSAKDKPALAAPFDGSGITFNVSHSGGAAFLAFGLRREIGIDVEQVRRDLDVEKIAKRYFSEEEQRQLERIAETEKFEAFFRCWTRKEAYIKACGEGLSLPLDQFDVSLAAGDRDALLATRPDASEKMDWLLREVPAAPGYVAALCAAGRDWSLRDRTD